MMDHDFILFWAPYGRWERVSAREFRRSRRAWRPEALGDDALVETIDDVGLEIYQRRDTNPVQKPCAYLRRVVAARLHDAYEQSLDPYERAALQAKKRARQDLARDDERDATDLDDEGDDEVGGWALIRYDDEGVGEVADASGQNGLEAVLDGETLRICLRAAARAVQRWRATESGRKAVVATIADIALRTLELLEEDPDALRVCVEGRDGLRLVVLVAMADVRPERWGTLPRYQRPSRRSVSPVLWQEIHGRYCEPVLELLAEVLGEVLGDRAAEGCG